jgi:hypothetical protein
VLRRSLRDGIVDRKGGAFPHCAAAEPLSGVEGFPQLTRYHAA